MVLAMANNVIKRLWNQNRMVTIEDLKGMTFQQEVSGHTFEITGVDDAGNIIALSGTPSGVLLRADDQEVALTCSVSDGKVYATIPANGYAVPGKFGLTVFLTASGQTTALYAAIGSVNRTASGVVAPPAGSDVATLINQINAAIAAIPANYNACFAPTYSTSGLYAVGQYVMNEGYLYRCTTAITTGETFTPAHWTQVALANDVSDLKSALKNSFGKYYGESVSDSNTSSAVYAKYLFTVNDDTNEFTCVLTAREDISVLRIYLASSGSYSDVTREIEAISNLANGASYEFSFSAGQGENVLRIGQSSSYKFDIVFKPVLSVLDTVETHDEQISDLQNELTDSFGKYFGNSVSDSNASSDVYNKYLFTVNDDTNEFTCILTANENITNLRIYLASGGSFSSVTREIDVIASLASGSSHEFSFTAGQGEYVLRIGQSSAFRFGIVFKPVLSVLNSIEKTQTNISKNLNVDTEAIKRNALTMSSRWQYASHDPDDWNDGVYNNQGQIESASGYKCISIKGLPAGTYWINHFAAAQTYIENVETGVFTSLSSLGYTSNTTSSIVINYIFNIYISVKIESNRQIGNQSFANFNLSNLPLGMNDPANDVVGCGAFDAVHIFHVGENQKYTKLKDGIAAAEEYFDSILYVDACEYDLIDEFGDDYFENFTGQGSYKDGAWGIVLKNRIHIIFAENAKVVCHYEGDNQTAATLFSAFNAGRYGFTLENANIDTSGIRYSVHDDRGDADEEGYCNKYLRCRMKHNKVGPIVSGMDQAIGGGFGNNGDILIQDSYFEAVGYQMPVTYHNSANGGTGYRAHCVASGNYLIGGFRFNDTGASTDVTDVYCFNNSISYGIQHGKTTEQAEDNIVIYQWNNYMRL